LNPKSDNHSSDIAQVRRFVGGWPVAIVVIAFTILWVLLIYRLVGDRPRDWEYGVEPYIPAQSTLSTKPTPSGPAPNQVQYDSKIRGRVNER